MSTDRKKKKRDLPRVERIKIIEYVCIGLVILLFLGLAIFYGGRDRSTRNNTAEADASPSPVPTDDPSIRGMNVLDALERASFGVSYEQDSYSVRSPNGVAFEMHMESDDRGLIELSFETPLCPDPDGETEIEELLRTENRQSIEAIRALFDAVMPVFHRPIADSDTIVKQSRNVVKSGEPYAKHFGTYSMRISSDFDAIPQTVTIRFVRDP